MNYKGPYYRYDIGLLNETISTAMKTAELYNCQLHYAIKANHEPEILKHIRRGGFGIDCVTAEEIEHAILQGWHPGSIVFAGSGKTIWEIDYALSQQIFVIHCESIEEYQYVQQKIKSTQSKTKIALRVNPEVISKTHGKISTGERHHKFGLTIEETKAILNNNNDVYGLHFHIGSQILDFTVFENLSLTVRGLIESLTTRIEYLNLGGGLGVNYDNPSQDRVADFKNWFKAIRKHLPESIIRTIHLEPGRSIVAQCGSLIGSVQYIKNRGSQQIAILDVGMNQLMRPAMYGARHHISILGDHFITQKYTVCGPSCESSDLFGHDFELPSLNQGDIMMIHSTGAYGSSMQLNYNLRKQIPSQYINQKIITGLKILSKAS